MPYNQESPSRESEFARRVNHLGFKPPAKAEDIIQLFSIVEDPGLGVSPFGPSRERFEMALVTKSLPAALMPLAGFILDQGLLPPF